MNTILCLPSPRVLVIYLNGIRCTSLSNACFSLMGLNETYAALQIQVLLMQPLPSVNQAYSMMVREESHRLHLSGVVPSIESSFIYSNAAGARRKFTGTCDHCKVKGHKKENLYRLIGFRADFKFSKKRGAPLAMVAVNSDLPAGVGSDVVSPSSSFSVVSSAPPVFTPEQYTQLLRLLNKASVADSSVNLAG
ncbi:uncharacterized protein LOC120123525 isoform X2 [Hibiscus syriacus]|uniref:uncharacterized protein LOC120123525 isoform X2 n=1 Tax=Hibiscus syriacus TaxID=106335 RepID=UPI00192144C8|nr:uncharacterized protein LOC120123525 isoform X2 [Hibiscus syriacus]